MDELYKCGYCGFVLHSQCDDLLAHQCLQSIYDEDRHVLVEDGKKVLTLVDKEMLQTVGAQGINISSNVSFEEQIIKFVQERPALYNIGLPLIQRSNAKKMVLWEEISNLFGGKITVDDLQKKWKYLRDCYIKARNKVKKYRPSGSEASPLPNPGFRYYEMMKFIDDGATSHITVSSISSQPSTSKATSTYIRSPTLDPSPSPAGTGNVKSTPSRKRKRTDEADLEKEITSLLSVPPEKPDGVDGFLIRLGGSLRKLPYRERCLVEIDIMKLAYDTECRLDIN